MPSPGRTAAGAIVRRIPMFMIAAAVRRIELRAAAALLAAGALASCAPLEKPPEAVAASNPTVTYNYEGDEQLLAASQKASVFCSQYQTVPRKVDIKIGRASCRERGGRYVENWGVGVSI